MCTYIYMIFYTICVYIYDILYNMYIYIFGICHLDGHRVPYSSSPVAGLCRGLRFESASRLSSRTALAASWSVRPSPRSWLWTCGWRRIPSIEDRGGQCGSLLKPTERTKYGSCPRSWTETAKAATRFRTCLRGASL